MFSIAVSSDGREVLGGANDGCLYVFDREQNRRTLQIESHEDDVNAVAFADVSSQILFSGGDDAICKVWDRRTMRKMTPSLWARSLGIRTASLSLTVRVMPDISSPTPKTRPSSSGISDVF